MSHRSPCHRAVRLRATAERLLERADAIEGAVYSHGMRMGPRRELVTKTVGSQKSIRHLRAKAKEHLEEALQLWTSNRCGTPLRGARRRRAR